MWTLLPLRRDCRGCRGRLRPHRGSQPIRKVRFFSRFAMIIVCVRARARKPGEARFVARHPGTQARQGTQGSLRFGVMMSVRVQWLDVPWQLLARLGKVYWIPTALSFSMDVCTYVPTCIPTNGCLTYILHTSILGNSIFREKKKKKADNLGTFR